MPKLRRSTAEGEPAVAAARQKGKQQKTTVIPKPNAMCLLVDSESAHESGEEEESSHESGDEEVPAHESGEEEESAHESGEDEETIQESDTDLAPEKGCFEHSSESSYDPSGEDEDSTEEKGEN